MDKSENDYRAFYAKGEAATAGAYDSYIEDGGGRYMVPYGKVRQAVFRGVSAEQLVDAEHAARLQYRLLLMAPVLMAAVDFEGRTISVTYNPEDATNRNERISLKGISDFLASEGVRVDPAGAESKDLDYYSEIYKYYHDPKVVREHPPYGYTLDEWNRGLKAKYEKDVEKAEKKKIDEFREWQAEYEREHPELKPESK
jgi:hypothetical protein